MYWLVYASISAVAAAATAILAKIGLDGVPSTLAARALVAVDGKIGLPRDFAAEPKNLTVIKHHFDAEHVIGRDSVGERMRTTGIVGDVAAN